MRSAAVAFFAFVLYLVLKNEVFGQQLSGGALVTYLIIFIPLLSLIGRSAKVTDDSSDQRQRNDSFRSRVETGEGPPEEQRVRKLTRFRGVLFLRPFEVDRQFRVRNPRKDRIAAILIFFYKMLLPDTVSIDDAFRLHSSEYGELLAIGEDDAATIGATRFASDDARWRDDVRALLAAAGRIILIPGRQEGITWELNEIVANREWLAKTVFVLTPHDGGARGGFPALDDMVAMLRAAGLDLPSDAAQGEGVVFHRDGQVKLRLDVVVRDFLEYRVSGRKLRRCLAAASDPTAADETGSVEASQG